MKPDYTQNCGYMGGKLEDIPLPHVRMFPNNGERKRKVELRFSSWVGGFAIGAKHVYVTLESERNPLWNHVEARWQDCWDDAEGKKTIRESAEFLHNSSQLYTNALGWIMRTLKETFPPELFVVHDMGILITDIPAFVKEQLEILDCRGFE